MYPMNPLPCLANCLNLIQTHFVDFGRTIWFDTMNDTLTRSMIFDAKDSFLTFDVEDSILEFKPTHVGQ